MINHIKISYLATLMLVMFLATNCSSTKGKKYMNDAEAAADIIASNLAVGDFPSLSESQEDSKFIVIALDKVSYMAGVHNSITLEYDNTIKAWNGYRQDHSRPVRGSNKDEKNITKDNQSPKNMSWLELMKALDKSNIHTILDSEDIDYKQVIADGEQFSLTIRVGDRQRRYSYSNPHFYAKEYSNIKDFANFAMIIDLLQQEFKVDVE